MCRPTNQSTPPNIFVSAPWKYAVCPIHFVWRRSFMFTTGHVERVHAGKEEKKRKWN